MKFAHAIARARERYNATLTPDDFDRIHHLVATHQREAIPLGRTPDGAILVAVRYKPADSRRRWLATVWRGEHIVTILPPLSLRRFGRKLVARRAELAALGRDVPKASRPWAERMVERRATEIETAWAAHGAGVGA